FKPFSTSDPYFHPHPTRDIPAQVGKLLPGWNQGRPEMAKIRKLIRNEKGATAPSFAYDEA
ncbi:MAG TPA: hypothetical protein VN106_11355, partial [Sphingomicrobium sp.]|nr:hypothetical protein [Sphingomicrobium sp.]